MARLTIDGYGQIELNRVSFPITGRVIADLPLDAGFNAATPAENGMILAYDYAAGKVTLPTAEQITNGGASYALHFTAEKEYDPQLPGLKNFKLVAGNFYPRLGILSVGDRFTTNTIDVGRFTNDATAKAALANCATTAVYGIPGTTGAITLSATLAGKEAVVLKAIKATTMPDTTYGVKFEVVKAQ